MLLLPLPRLLACSALLLLGLLAARPAHAADLLLNDFSTVSPKNYTGVSGEAFGTDPLLGNATGRSTTQAVAATSGTGSSAGLTSNDLGVRTRTTLDIRGITFRYTVDFLFAPNSTSLIGNFLGFGWALPAGADNISTWTGGGNDKLLVALRRTDATSNTVRLGTAGSLSAAESLIPGAPEDITTATLTPGNWYRLSFQLRFNHDADTPADSTLTVSSLTLHHRGTTGTTTPGTLVLSLATATLNSPSGTNLDTNQVAHPILVGNFDRGTRTIDNLQITDIDAPPPPPPPVDDPALIPTTPDPLTVADFNLPPQDSAGWTLLTPVSTSRLVYVDSVNGDDATALTYTPASAAVGPNPRQPIGPILAFRTVAAAFALTRADQPDWLLLKAGGFWEENLNVRNGRNASERFVVTAYGTGPRPELRTGANRGIAQNSASFLIVKGIRFWAHTRDYESSHFTGIEGSVGFGLNTLGGNETATVRDILIEDCVFRCYDNNTLTGNVGNTGRAKPIERFVLRRSQILRNYSDGSHSQGLFHDGAGQAPGPSILLEDNLFDHNGWRLQATSTNTAEYGRATIFNHNTYFANAHGVLFRHNLFLRPSSIGNKWTANYGASSSSSLVMDNNFYAEGELGISIGGNDPGPLRFRNVRIRNNVFTDIGRTQPTSRNLAWSIEARDWDYGSITDNLFLHQRISAITNVHAIVFDAQHQARTAYIAGNVIANMRGDTFRPLIDLRDGARTTNVLLADNTIQSPVAHQLIGYTTGGFSFTGLNLYHSTATTNNRFRIDGAATNIDTWIATSGDTGATFALPAFPAPTRDLESYAASLGLTPTIQAFVNAAMGQSESSWNPALTAPAVNDWIRAGFIEPLTPASPFETWVAAQSWPGDSAQTALPTADPDGDGLANLLEYALGSSPTASASQPILISQISNRNLQLEFTPHVLTGLTYVIEASPDLVTWSETHITSLLTAGQPYTYTDPVPVDSTNPRRFLRLRISQ